MTTIYYLNTTQDSITLVNSLGCISLMNVKNQYF